MKKKILFIVNPMSGVGKQKDIDKKIPNYLCLNTFDYQIAYTKAAHHAIELSQQAIGHFDYVVAVGGDGTVNEVSQGLAGSDVPMGIIPMGSGNGLARYLSIPMQTEKAIQTLNHENTYAIDTAILNNTFFVNVAGVGFDAYVSHEFSTFGKRGPVSYLKVIAKELQNYTAENYKLTIDGKTFETQAFLISFANSSEFGNNAHIAPNACINDGQLDVCIFSPFPIHYILDLTFRLFTKTLDQSEYVTIIKASEVEIESAVPLQAHVDGEPIVVNKKIRVKVFPKNLRVVAGKKFKP